MTTSLRVSKRAALVCATSLLIGGCTVGPDYHPPHTETPAGWIAPPPPSTAPSTMPTTRESVATTRPADVATWWQAFDDPELDALVRRAIESNLDLKQAEARIRQARAARNVAASGYYPTVNTNGSYNRTGGGGSGVASIQTTPNGTSTIVTSERSRDLWEAGLDASWELDVFGGIRRGVEATDADIQFAIEDRRDVLVTLTSEVALNYLALRGFQRQIVIAYDNLKSQEYSADLTRRRQRGGLVSGLDVANAEAQVATTRSQIPVLEQAARQTIYDIGILLGQQPESLVAELTPDAPIPTTPPVIPIGLPSDLLRRRPDIRRVESQLHAATARIGVATADLFPKFTLTGSLGVQASSFGGLGNWNNSFWSIGPGVTWPLFAGGRIVANIEVQKAIGEESLLLYESTVLIALRDVESALVAYAKEQEHRSALVEAVSANRRAVDLATRLYQQGQTDFLNVLTAQRSLFLSEDALVQSDRTVATNLVALYKALGGGWEASPEPVKVATTQAVQ